MSEEKEAIAKCQECGAGKNADGTKTFPSGYPFSDPCQTCQKRMERAMRELGGACRESVDKRFLEAIDANQHDGSFTGPSSSD